MFCRSEFWDEELFYQATNPDFTECFHRTILVYIPCAFLWLCLPLHLGQLRRTSFFRNISRSKLLAAKIVLITFLLLLEVVDLVHSIAITEPTGNSKPIVIYLTPIIVIATLTLDLTLIVSDEINQNYNSKTQFFFWFLLWFLATSTFASCIRKLLQDGHESSTQCWIQIVYWCLGFSTFVLHCFSDVPSSEYNKYSEEERASVFSILFFRWLDPVFWQGFRNPLEKQDVPELKKELQANYIAQAIEKQLGSKRTPIIIKGQENQACDNKIQDNIELYDIAQIAYPAKEDENTENINILFPLIKAFGGKFGVAIILKLCQDLLKFVAPQILKKIIKFIRESSDESEDAIPLWQGYFLACSLFLINLFQLLILQQYWMRCYQTGMEMKVACINLIYKKTLKLSNSARKKYTVGQIVNLITTDAETIQDVLPSLNMVWSMPLQIMLALYFLYKELGVAVLSGVTLLVLLVPFNVVTGRYTRRYQGRQVKCKDRRIRAMYEILNCIKIIKFYAWEESFSEKITNIRGEEIGFLKKIAVLKAIVNFVFGSVPMLVTLASFATYVSISDENVLTADKVFVCISLFNLLRLPMHLLPNGINEALRFSVSVKRINKFLRAANMTKNVLLKPDATLKSKTIEILGGSFTWDLDEKPALDNINLEIPQGSLVAIVGRVGSGKSSLLSSILSETDKVQGSLTIQAREISYVSQQPWIQNMTVKDNILFGSEENMQWYDDVIHGCALKQDFSQLMDGEDTMIGENGINLSGGQKQRVSIARAVYRNADLYLFDDPLSALDSHTADHVFSKVISNNGLLKGSTRLLATHRTNILNQVDFVLVLKDGKVSEFGPPNQFLTSSSELSAIIKEAETKEQQNEEEVKEKAPKVTKKKQNGVKKDAISNDAKAQKAKDAETRIKDQGVLSGRVKLMAYNKFIRSVGYFNSILILVFYILNQSVSTGGTIWIANWSDQSDAVMQAESNGTASTFDNNYYVGVLGGFSMAQGVVSLFRNWFFFMSCAAASIKIHRELFQVIIRARMRFFDTTPTGSMINRFSGDMQIVDVTLPQALSSLLYTLIEVFSVVVVISISFPFFLILVLPLGVLYYGLLRLFIPTSRQVKRFESSTKSPVNLHFSETVSGASIIRAFGEEARFIQESEHLLGTNLQFKYVSVMGRRWLGLRSEFMGNVSVLLAAVLAVAQRESVSAGWAGLSVTYALSITETFNYLLVNASNVEEQAVSVERIRETEKYTPTEKEWKNSDEDPQEKNWLKKGDVNLDNLTLSYAPDLPPVLHNLTLDIKNGDRIGVCGRTGAGKSSLSVALFNMVESWQGKITLDGKDASKLGLHTLRSQMTVIAQDPVLFHSSVRSNLDPTGSLPDDAIWRSLEQSQMKNAIMSLKNGLDHEVEEGGSNFSVGERQLLCLSRALLRQSQIVILDEATASMDQETDDKVQETLFNELKGKTLITIAHRLDTIVNYDKILVLDHGRVKEFDSPQTLLNDSKSQFYAMMQKNSQGE